MIALETIEKSSWNERFLARLSDGATVETVLYRGDSLCVSCQVGCAVACPFCASGARGLKRGLTLEELAAQVEAVRSLGRTVRRVTVSGVGEPLHVRALFPFLDWCRERRLPPSVTTSGGPVERLRELIHAPHNGLTISMHAGREETRRRAVPNGPSLAAIVDVLRAERELLSRSRLRKIALAYLVVGGLNDSDDEIDAFCALVAPLEPRVHLYAYNPVPTSSYRPVPRARYEAIYAKIRAAGLRASMSSQARLEANGGCGTLVAIRAN